MGSGPGGEGVAEGLGMVQGKLELQDIGPCVDLGLGEEPHRVSAHHASHHGPGVSGPRLVTSGQSMMSCQSRVL